MVGDKHHLAHHGQSRSGGSIKALLHEAKRCREEDADDDGDEPRRWWAGRPK